jgi:hypothetical protein
MCRRILEGLTREERRGMDAGSVMAIITSSVI